MIDVNGNPTILNVKDCKDPNVERIFEYAACYKVIHYHSREEGLVDWIDYSRGKVKWTTISGRIITDESWENLLPAIVRLHYNFPIWFQTMSDQKNGPYSGLTEQQIKDKAKLLAQTAHAAKNAGYAPSGQVNPSSNKTVIVVPWIGGVGVAPGNMDIIGAFTGNSAQKADDRFPHKCPYCGGSAYIGFNSLDCKGKCR